MLLLSALAAAVLGADATAPERVSARTGVRVRVGVGVRVKAEPEPPLPGALCVLCASAVSSVPNAQCLRPNAPSPVQRLVPTPEGEQESLRTEHFDIVYHPSRLS